MMIGHLEDVLLVLDMIDLLQTDHVVEGEDLEGEEVGGGLVAAEANPGKGSYRWGKYCQFCLKHQRGT